MKANAARSPLVSETLRERIRRGVDIAAFGGASLASLIAIVNDMRDESGAPAAAQVILFALAATGLAGWRYRLRWTPISYVGLVVFANIVYLSSFGPWFGLGVVYVLAIALAFLFMSARWSWVVGAILVGTPLALGVLQGTGLYDPAAVMYFDDWLTWRRTTIAALTALAGVGLVSSFAVRELTRERRDFEDALERQRCQRLEQDRVDEELARGRRAEAIAQLAAEVGAEIGAALAVVHVRATALSRELRSSDAAECLRDIDEATRNARSMMRSLTVFAPEDGEAQFGNAAEAVRALPNLVRRTIPARIALEVTTEEDAWVGIDTTDLSRICANLVLNARDAIAETGQIAVRVARDGDEVVIEVSDSGAGMSEEVQARLFQPFFTTKPVGRGTGLGLATTKVLVDRARGRIAVRSAVGHGTTFAIRLPALDVTDGQIGT